MAAAVQHAMLRRMQLDTGGRFSLQLAAHDGQGARFELVLSTAEARWQTNAEVAASDGAVVLAGWDVPTEPPAWLVAYARAALRSAWRQHAEHGWPRRLTRWRDAPERSAAPESDEA